MIRMIIKLLTVNRRSILTLDSKSLIFLKSNSNYSNSYLSFDLSNFNSLTLNSNLVIKFS